MPKILTAPNGRAILLTPRSGSHSIAAAMLAAFHPEVVVDPTQHPAASYPPSDNYSALCAIVRHPVERFRSMVARAGSTVDEQLARPLYGQELFSELAVDRLFRFEGQLAECMAWLGVTSAIPHLDATEPSSKPTLTPEQESRVREIYAGDIAIWESL